jgi:prepilin-type N-terminal cleavage/methylation domain-containing protein
MNCDAIVPGVGRSRGRGAKRGYTLVEALVVMVIMSVLVAMGIPRFQQSLEQSRADVAGASLRSIWSAQRLYWLQYRTYAPDLPTLQSANLIDPSLTTATAPYTYQVVAASDSSFTATATRSGSSFWSGSFTIAADGTFSGSVQQSGQGPLIAPNYQ